MNFKGFLERIIEEVSKALMEASPSAANTFLIPKVINQGIQVEFLVQFPEGYITLSDRLLILAGYFGWTFPQVEDLWLAYLGERFSVKVTLAVNSGLPTGQIFMDLI